MNKRCANRLSSSEIENRANASKISNVIETRSRNSRDLVSKGNIGIKNKTVIASWGWRKNRDTITQTKCRTLYFIQLRLEMQQQEFSLWAVETEQIWGHPACDGAKTSLQTGNVITELGCLEGCEQLGVISIQMMIKSEWRNEWAQRSSIQWKEESSQNRALRYTVATVVRLYKFTRTFHTEWPVRKIRSKPSKYSAMNSKPLRQVLQQNGMVNGIKSSR